MFGFYAGWRKGEILGLQWKQIDLQAKVVRLEADQSKNDEARTLAYGQHAGLVELLVGQDEARKALLRESGKLCPWVFHHDGRAIRDFYHAWREATRKAGVPGRLFHDLRRSCVRNMERAGVSRSVATKITGHKTETIYRRYAIVSEADVAAGLGKVSGALGHISATNGGLGASEVQAERSQAVGGSDGARGGS